MITITTLIENKLGPIPNLTMEHGLSFYIEADGKKTLFDTGQSGDFIHNAQALKVDLNHLDDVILSHGHYDHSGGFKKLVENFPSNYQLLIGGGFFNEKYKVTPDQTYVFTGNSFDYSFLEKNKIAHQIVQEDITYLTDHIMIFTNFIRNKQYTNLSQTSFIKKDNQYILDEFTDEIAMGINTSKGLIVIVGCAHVGIINILETIQQRTGLPIYGLIGGTHLVASDRQEIDHVADYLNNNNITSIGLCHCTGDKAQQIIQDKLEDYVYPNHTGHKFKLY